MGPRGGTNRPPACYDCRPMAATRCPHCQAPLDEPVTFCGACGRRVAGWQGDIAGGPDADSAAVTRRAEVNSELRRAIRSTRPTDPSLDLALQAATGPKLVQWITVFVGVGLVAFVAAVVSYRRLHKPIERPKATPEITKIG